MSEAEHPEDEQRDEASAEEVPAETAEEAPAAETADQTPATEAADEAPAAPAEEAPVASEEPAAPDTPPGPSAEPVPEPVPAEPTAESTPEPTAESTPEPTAESAPEPAAESTPESTPQPAAESTPEPAGADDESDEDGQLTPRRRPEIPGADLIPDLVSEADEFLDAEARAAAEAEAEEAARAGDDDSQEHSQPIADAAIDLAAGARYTATGKRKTAVARVIIKPGTGTYLVNGKELVQFFPRETLQRMIRQPLETVGYDSRMDVVARMHGGGVAAQAGALRHAISRALIDADPNLRGELKRRGFLTRDPRVKERKKAGLKKARKRPQFSKR